MNLYALLARKMATWYENSILVCKVANIAQLFLIKFFLALSFA